MEPPFLVFRDQTKNGRQVVTSIPIADFFKMQWAARQLMWKALQGDQRARQSIETLFQVAMSNDPERGKPVVSTYLLREALAEARELQESQQSVQGTGRRGENTARAQQRMYGQPTQPMQPPMQQPQGPHGPGPGGPRVGAYDDRARAQAEALAQQMNQVPPLPTEPTHE